MLLLCDVREVLEDQSVAQGSRTSDLPRKVVKFSQKARLSLSTAGHLLNANPWPPPSGTHSEEDGAIDPVQVLGRLLWCHGLPAAELLSSLARGRTMHGRMEVCSNGECSKIRYEGLILMNIPQVGLLSREREGKTEASSKRLLLERPEADPLSFICAVVLIVIKFANMHGFVPDCENCLSGWASASAPGTCTCTCTCSCGRDTPSLSACRAPTPQMERMHTLAVPACIVEFDCGRKRSESCMEAHKRRSTTSLGPPTQDAEQQGRDGRGFSATEGQLPTVKVANNKVGCLQPVVPDTSAATASGPL